MASQNPVTIEVLDAAISKLSKKASRAFSEAAAVDYRLEIARLMTQRRRLVRAATNT